MFRFKTNLYVKVDAQKLKHIQVRFGVIYDPMQYIYIIYYIIHIYIHYRRLGCGPKVIIGTDKFSKQQLFFLIDCLMTRDKELGNIE